MKDICGDLTDKQLDELVTKADVKPQWGDYRSITAFLESVSPNGYLCMKIGKVDVRAYVRKGMRYRAGVTHKTFEIGTILCYPFNQGGFRRFIQIIEEVCDLDIYVESIHSRVLLDCLPRYGFVLDPLDDISMMKCRCEGKVA